MPAPAVYAPNGNQPWDDAVTMVLTYAEIPYETIYDTEVLAERYLDSLNLSSVARWQSFQHTFTHFHLMIHPIHVRLKHKVTASMIEDNECRWVTPGEDVGGLPAPVSRIIDQLQKPVDSSN